MTMPPPTPTPPVLVVMAVFNPKPDHLRAQLASLAAQRGAAPLLIAVIADTRSAALVQTLANETGLQAELVEPSQELDAVRAFEAGLYHALIRIEEHEAKGTPPPLVALCDQDDIWHPDRLARGLATLASTRAALVHSDARLIDDEGRELHPSMFAFEKRHRNPGLRGLLLRNNITGMTVLMRPDVLHMALPFPPQSGVHFYHDLWLGLVAQAMDGGIALIREPLVEYRQHDANAIGAIDRQTRPTKRRRLPDAKWLRREAASYALARYLAVSLHNRNAEAVAAGHLPPDSTRLSPLRPFLCKFYSFRHLFDAVRLLVTGHARLARISAGYAVVALGRLVMALRDTFTSGLTESLSTFDQRLYGLSPGVVPLPPNLPDEASEKATAKPYEKLIDLRKTASWTPILSQEAHPVLNVLVPTLNPTEMFAGIATALDIGLRLVARGHRVRFIGTDLPVSSAVTSQLFLRRRLTKFSRDTEAHNRFEIYCGVTGGTLDMHPNDRFLATAWWSAHVADQLIRDHGFSNARFFYLIQDFEPNFYPWGQEFADAMASYALDFEPIFNTTLLRDHFIEQGFACATPDALAFHPSIDISHYSGGIRPKKTETSPRRLVLYGRPEVARNMYATAIEALALFIEESKLAPKDIELVSVGLRHTPVRLPRGLQLKSLGKLPWEDYPGYLLSTDLGLSLMYSPHPSHPPIEMAASGVRVVTNHFGPKDLSRLSPAILSTEPTAPALALALSKAWNAPPVSAAERAIDLSALGLPLDDMVDRLADRLTQAPQAVIS